VPATIDLLDDHWTTLNGRSQRIFAQVSNHPSTDALPIVLVHGLGVSGKYLLPTARLLASHHRVAVPDLPGWGQSSHPEHTLSLAELADVLAAWMTAIDMPRATLLGNSFGCQIIVEFALRHADQIDRAVLVGPSGDPSRRSPFTLLPRLAWDGVRERPSHVVQTLRDYRQFGIRRGIETFRIMVNDPIAEKLPHMTMPTLVVRGGDDPIVSQRWVDRMTALLPFGESVVVPSAAHAVNDDDPDALTSLVENFLAKPIAER
jgi:2-hydroxy-6-oxonona-2,4-dienedioate hydrolase